MQRVLRRAVLPWLLGGLLVFMWFGYHFLSQQRGVALEASRFRREYPIAGLALVVPGEDLREVMTSANRDAPDAAHRLFILVDDACRQTAIQVERWQRLIRRLSPREVREIVAVSFDGTEVINTLARAAHSRQIGYRGFVVANKPVFKARTGLTSTPQTLVLDREWRVRLAQGGIVPDPSEHAIASFLQNPGTVSTN